MISDRRPLFTSDWPRYAIAAHVVFWLTSAVFLTSGIASLAGAIRTERSFFMFALWIVTVALVGAAAVCSGKLYSGNQVFSREPTTGWPARGLGAVVFLAAAALIIFGYGLTQVRGP